ncbi:hypothetical protein D5F01_LYC15193 [Larimichthys crocea]|uniref:L1 transposable element RRM domain-containing protein n=1 Tax=Larimichthys crocea TaxID=215358 RepID=A0A6G0I724_LARCR|nr:hypothetical protein D5F01_LYC15193 [Larimichthys crocea]
MKVNTRLDEAEGRIEKAKERIQNTEDVVTAMLKLHTKLEDKLLDLESRSRRENMRIYGVPEGSEKESTTMISFVENLLREGLELTHDMPDLQIERAHRSLGPQPPRDAPPRSIIIKCLSFKTKETLLHKAWQKKGFTWQENRINLDHDYPPLILKKRREYTEIRKKLKEKGVQFQTLFPARLRVRHKDGTRTYETVEEASEDLLRRGYAVTTASGDAHGAGAAADRDEGGQTSKDGPSRMGSKLQGEAPSLQESITDPLRDWRDLTYARR